MKNFNDSWQKFLNESSRTKNVPPENSRTRIKLENKQDLLYEVTDEEFDHIMRAIEDMPLDELAFHDIFGDKTRLVVDFPSPELGTPLGRFVAMWKAMGYEVDWSKGIVSSTREYIDTSPSGVAAMITGGSFRKSKKVNMKIGKWLSRMLGYTLKYKNLADEIKEKTKTDIARDNRRSRAPRVTGEDIERILGPERAKDYYRLPDTINMMIYTNQGDEPEYIRALRNPEKIQELSKYWTDNAADIKKSLDKAQSNEYSIIITRNPIDVWRMSDFENITSCHSPPSRDGGGMYYKCAVAEAHGHGAVAYAVNTEELLKETESKTIEEAEAKLNQYDEIFIDDTRDWAFRSPDFDITPDMRVRLRQVRYYTKDKDDDGTQIAVPEKRTYGAQIPGFNERIVQWARETQETEMAEAPRTEDGKLELDKFTKFGGTYDDNPISRLLSRLFGDTITGTEGHVKADSTTEDELDDEALTSGLIAQYQRDINNAKEEWNQYYEYCRVDGEALDDGGDGVYISLEGQIVINWDASDWRRMPNAYPDIRYGLEELKEYGMNWVDTNAWGIRRQFESKIWQLPIAIRPEGLVGFHGHEFAFVPEEFDTFCGLVNKQVDDKYEVIKQILTTYFRREGYMAGGALMALGREIINDDTGLRYWEAEAEEGWEPDEYELLQFTAMPDVKYRDYNVSREIAMKIMNDRNFWIEIRRRMAAPAFKSTGHSMYPQMPLDMNMFNDDGPDGQEINLYFSVHEDAPDEQVEVLERLVNIWDDQDKINRVVNEVFRDMVQGVVKLDGTTISDLNEEKKLLEIDALLDEKKKKKKKKKAKRDACYHKVKSRYKVWPSAYASGALVKCRKVGAANWGNKSKKKNEDLEADIDAIIDEEIELYFEKKELTDKNLEKVLRDEGGASGMDPFKKEIDATEEEIKDALKKMKNVGQHEDGDYILGDGEEIKIIESIIEEEIQLYFEKKKKKKKAGSESSKESSLRDWFGRKGAPGKKGGWVDCNTCRKDKKTGRKKCKPCGRSGKEKRSKYPSCRPTPGACGERGKGKSWGKKSSKGKK